MLRPNLQTGRFYDLARVFYPLLEPSLKARRQRLIRMVNEASAGELLEIGVGPGTHLRDYERHRVTAIDVSAGMLETAARRAGPDVTFHQMDGEELTFPDTSFDCVVMSHVLAVTETPERMLAEAHRVLRPGGRLFVLNHETPVNALRHWDRVLSSLGRMCHIKSVFHLDEVPGYDRFTQITRERVGVFGYYAITVLEK